MIIKFNGETSINKLGKLVQEVVKNIQERAEKSIKSSVKKAK